MPIKRGIAGKSTYDIAERRHKAMILTAVIEVIIFCIIVSLVNNSKTLKIGGVGFLILFLLLVNFPDILDNILGKQQKKLKQAERGARAEVRVDSLLDDLSEDYIVLNDVVSQYGNIDHIVISRNGDIFLIETKSHGGKVTFENGELLVNGYLPEKDFLRQTLSNLYWLRERVFQLTGVKPWITPLLVFTNAFVPFTPPVKGIKVMNKKFLMSTIEQSPSASSSNGKIWEAREKIEKGLVS